MSRIPFPIKDMKRRKLPTLLTILSLTISVASTIFLILMGENIGFNLESVTGGQLASGFSLIFSRFIVFVSILNLLTGALVVLFLFSLAMSERIRDIGVMKAFGCLTSSVFGIFATELFLMIFLGCIIGTVAGLVAYLGVSYIIGLSYLSNVNWWSILLVLLGFFLLSHFFGAKPIVKAIQMKPADALSSSHLFGTTTEFSGKSLSRFGLTLRVAFRSLMRRALPTRNIFLCLTMILTLVTVAVAGGLVAKETTVNYLERAVGRDVILVAHKDMIEQYANLLLQFQEAKPIKTVDYFDLRYAIPESLIQQLTNIPSVTKSEKRLLFETTVYEGYGVIIYPFDSSAYYFVGEGRSGKTFAMGIEPANVVSNWLIQGKPLTNETLDSAMIGASLADTMFTKPLNQTIKISESSYEIAGICIDPFNNGNVSYVSFNSLSSSLREFGNNLLFLKTNRKDNTQFLAQIDSFLSETNFEFLELNSVLDENISFLEKTWSLVMLLPLSSLATAVFCLFIYLMFSITEQQREFGIMRALGTKIKVVAKIVVVQVLAILFASSISGASIGFLIVYLLMIPEPIISLSTIYALMILIGLAIVFLTLFSLYATLKVIRKPILETLHPLLISPDSDSDV